MVDYYTTWSLNRTWHIFKITDTTGEKEVESVCGSKTSTRKGIQPVEEKQEKLRTKGCGNCKAVIENQEPELYREIEG